MSIQATKLAADLASFKNLEIDVALQKIRAGLVGEVEPLRTVGVLLSAAAVEAKAAELGLQDMNGELSEGAKVQARMALIMGQLSDAQGDVARTSESVANQTREMQKNMENLRAEIGEKLLPVTADLLESLNGMVTGLERVPDPAIQAGVGIGALTAAIAGLGLIIPPLVTGTGALVTFASLLGTIAAAPITLGLTALGAGLGVVGVGMRDIASDVDAANESLHGFDGVLKTLGEQQKYDDILEQIVNIEEVNDRFKVGFEDLATVFQSRAGDISGAGAKMSEAVVLQMASIDTSFTNTKSNAIELQRFLNDVGNKMTDSEIAAAQAIVDASNDRYEKLAELRAKDLADDLASLKLRSDAVEALKAENLEAFRAIEATVNAAPSVIAAGVSTGGREASSDRANIFRSFKDSQNEITDRISEIQSLILSKSFAEFGVLSEASLREELDSLHRIAGRAEVKIGDRVMVSKIEASEQFKGGRLAELFAPPGGFGSGAPPTLPGQVFGQGVPGVTVVVEGSVVAEDLPSIVERGLRELADQGNGFIDGQSFNEQNR
jgi:hypothetical protein